MSLVFLLLGALLGGAVAWIVASARGRKAAESLAAAEATSLAAAAARDAAASEASSLRERVIGLERASAGVEERAAELQRQLVTQKSFLDDARRGFESTFQALAGKALEGSQERFLELEKARLGARHAALEGLLTPVRQSLEKLESRTGEIEKAREGAYARIDEQVRQLSQATAGLADRTTALATALKTSTVRGSWGEAQLRNVAELAGMLEHCDFECQEVTPDGGRPDMTVRLPGNRRIAVDAKAPLSAYLEAAAAKTDDDRDAALAAHVLALRGHVRSLGRREYAESLGDGVGLVVLFLPGESFFADAFARDPGLQEDAWRQNVLIATPTTLIALLRTVSILYQKEAVERDAQKIAETARKLYDRLVVFARHLGGVGDGLKKALKSYNEAVASYDTRLRPISGSLEDLKVPSQGSAAPPELHEIEEVTRVLEPGHAA